MLKLIVLNYTVMMNDYSKWLNNKGKHFFIETYISDAGLQS